VGRFAAVQHVGADAQAVSIVARIPKQVVLSQRTSSLSQDLLSKLPSSLSPPLRLAVCLLHEQLLGPKSKWNIVSLPTDVVPIAVLWPNESEARRWAKGTELGKELQGVQLDSVSRSQCSQVSQCTKPTSIQTSLAALFDSVVLPFFLSSPSPPSPAPTLPQFLHAYSIVSSRAFQVDSWHSLSLVPFADIFNHMDEHDVHLESEHWVCPECGALDACEHDDAEESDAPTSRQLVEDDSCEMVTVQGISAGQEVFNTYGELSNAQLLAFYGFTLEANKYDRITFAFDDVARLAPSPLPSSITEEWSSLVKLWQSEQNEDESMGEDFEDDTLIVDSSSGHLYIDADARLSSSLWLLLLLLHIPLPATSSKRLALLRRLRESQVRIVNGEEGVLGKEPSSLEGRALRVLAEAVRSLCAARLAGQEEARRTGGELLEMASVSGDFGRLIMSKLTSLSRTQKSTGDASLRQALELAASERILQECVSQTWFSLLDGPSE
jgi:hypothetical protein